MKRTEIYGGITVDLNDGPIRAAYGRDTNGKQTAQLVIGEVGESIGIAVTRSDLHTIEQLEAVVAELKAWRERQNKLHSLPEVA